MTTTTNFARCAALGFGWVLFVCAPSAQARSPASQSQDSVAYQINRNHTGSINFAGGFSSSLAQLWSVNLNGSISYPLTANGTAFVTIGASSGALLAAVNLSTGAIVWEKLLPGSSSWADAIYDSGKIFVANGAADLLSFRATGKPLWSVQLTASGYQSVGAPAARNGMVVLQYNGGYQQTVSAYEETTGTNLWTVSPNFEGPVNGIGGVPVLTKNGVYVGSDEGFNDLSPGDGSAVWSATLTCNPYDSPVLSHGSLFVTMDSFDCSDGSDTIFDPEDGSVEGEFAGSTAPVVLGKTLIVSLDGVLYDYSPRNGNVHWSFAGDGQLYENPVVINGYVAAISQFGNLYLLDGSTGEQLWTTTLATSGVCCEGPDPGLGAGEGVLLVPFDGTLYAFAPQQGAKRESRPEPTRVIGRLINGRFIPN